MKQFWAVGVGVLVASVACERKEEPAAAATEANPPATSTAATKPPAPPPAAKPPAAAPADSPCSVVCQRAVELGCRGASACPQMCAEMLSQPQCSQPLRAALKCFATHPTKDWECDEDGMASIKDGICDPEQAEVARCVSSAG